jgi:hypothetical protein
MKQQVPTIEYNPPGPMAAAFMNSDAFFRGIMGPFGSGKSTACIMELLFRAMEQEPGADGKRHTRWAVIRNTYPELKTTTIKSWHQWIPAHLGRWVDTGPPSHHLQFGDVDMEVLFLALDRPDDIAKLLSMELTGAWINEAREVPKAVVDGLTGRVGRFPSVLMGGCTWSGIIADTNPPDNDHWWYRLAEEERPNGWEFFRQPGGLDPEAENVANLPEQYYHRQLSGKDDDWVRVYIHGEYGFVRDGKPIYPEYKDSVHCQEFMVIPQAPIYIGIDFGLTPAAVFGQRTAMGQWRWHSELVTEDMGAKRFSELLRHAMAERYPGHTLAMAIGDPAGDTRAQTDEITPFQILRAAGVPATPAPTNDFIKRRESVAASLSRLIDGEPGLIIHPNCKMLRKAMSGGYNYRRLQVSGEERYRDVPDKNIYSHVAEAGQYMLVGAGEARDLIKRHRPYNRRTVVAESDYALFG